MVAMLLSELIQVPPVPGMAVIVELTQVTSEEVLTSGKEWTVIVPVVVVEPQPSGVISYSKVPLCIGVPLMIIVLASYIADTPKGNPLEKIEVIPDVA